MTTVTETGFAGLRPHLDAADVDAVVAWLAGMPERERRALAVPLRARWRETDPIEIWRRQSSESGRPADYHAYSAAMAARRAQGMAYLAASCGTVSGAKTLARWMFDVRRRTPCDWGDPRLVRVLTDRAPTWLDQLPERLVEVFGPSIGPEMALITAVAAAAGVTPAATDGYVHGWAFAFYQTAASERAAALRGDPRTAEFIPRLFTFDAADHFFGPYAASLRDPVLELAADGTLDRGVLLDASLNRLLRGGRPGAVRDHLAFLAALEPTPREIARRAGTVLGVLATGRSFAAGRMVEDLRRADDDGCLDVDTAREAAVIAVGRAEKKLVRAGLSWLDALIKRHPDRRADLLDAVAEVFTNPDAALQQKAVTLVVRHGRKADSGVRAHLAGAAAAALPSDLAARVAKHLDVSVDKASAAAVGLPLGVPPFVPRELPPPIESPAELAETLGVILTSGPQDGVDLDRALEALVRFTRADRPAVGAALGPLLTRHGLVEHERRAAWDNPPRALRHLLEIVTAPHHARRRLTAVLRTLTAPDLLLPRHAAMALISQWSPATALSYRMAEIAVAVQADAVPPLVATPTNPTGILDPDVLLQRLSVAEAEGWQPLPSDLDQALLRLPRGTAPVDIGTLRSEAALRLAAWTADGGGRLPAAEQAAQTRIATLRITELQPAGETWFAPYPTPTGRKWKPESPTFLTMLDRSWTAYRVHWDDAWAQCWPAVIPGVPDLAALAHLAHLDSGWPLINPAVPALVAEQDDAAHNGLHLLVARYAVDDRDDARAAAVDAALILAARGRLNGAGLGATLARLIAKDGAARLRRTVAVLRDLANAGAAREVWAVLAAVVPSLLPPERTRALPFTAELLSLAAEIVPAVPAAASIPAVAAMAQRGGSTAVATAARRLDLAMGTVGAGGIASPA